MSLAQMIGEKRGDFCDGFHWEMGVVQFRDLPESFRDFERDVIVTWSLRPYHGQGYSEAESPASFLMSARLGGRAIGVSFDLGWAARGGAPSDRTGFEMPEEVCCEKNPQAPEGYVAFVSRYKDFFMELARSGYAETNCDVVLLKNFLESFSVKAPPLRTR